MVKTDGVLAFFSSRALTSAISYNKRELSYNNGLSSGMIGQIDVTLPQEITTVFNEKENIDKELDDYDAVHWASNAELGMRPFTE